MSDVAATAWRRAVVALLLGLAGVGALAYGVGANEAAAGQKAAESADALAPKHLLPQLPRADGELWLVGGGRPVPAGVGWAVAIGADGEVVVSALGAEPGPGAAAVPAAVAVHLPSATWAELSPAARGSLVEVLGRMLAERPVPPDRFRTVGLAVERGQLDRLLAWVR